ncbi:MAG: hypothetical protein U1E65_03130 [Myxococcota bacterium]
MSGPNRIGGAPPSWVTFPSEDPVTTPAPPSAPRSSVWSDVSTYALNTARGYGTGALNLVLGTASLVNRGVNAGLSLTPIDYRFQTDLEIAPRSRAESDAQRAVEIASLATGAAGLVRSAPAIARRLDGAVEVFRRPPRTLPEVPRGPIAAPPEPLRLPPRGSLPARGELVGEGETARTFLGADGNTVIKEMRSQIHGIPLTEAERTAMAERTVEQHRILRERGFPVPESWVPAEQPGTVVQARAQGLRFEELSPEARRQAARNKIEMVAQAERDRSVAIDPGMNNFRFDREGRITEWFDPAIPYDTEATQRIGMELYLRRQ